VVQHKEVNIFSHFLFN